MRQRTASFSLACILALTALGPSGARATNCDHLAQAPFNSDATEYVAAPVDTSMRPRIVINTEGGSFISFPSFMRSPDTDGVSDRFIPETGIDGWGTLFFGPTDALGTATVFHRRRDARVASSRANSPAVSDLALPLVLRAFADFTTIIQVINDHTEAANIDIEFPSAACRHTIAVPSFGLDLVDLREVSCLSNGFLGSALVSSDKAGPIAATAIHGNGSTLLAHAGRVPAWNLRLPALAQNNNLFSLIAIQNTTGSTANVNVHYYPFSSAGDGETITPLANTPITLAPHASYFDFAAHGAGGQPLFSSAQVESDQGIAVTAAVLALTGQAGLSGFAYNATDTDRAGNSISAPEGSDRTVYFISNVGGSRTTVQCGSGAMMRTFELKVNATMLVDSASLGSTGQFRTDHCGGGAGSKLAATAVYLGGGTDAFSGSAVIESDTAQVGLVCHVPF